MLTCKGNRSGRHSLGIISLIGYPGMAALTFDKQSEDFKVKRLITYIMGNASHTRLSWENQINSLKVKKVLEW